MPLFTGKTSYSTLLNLLSKRCTLKCGFRKFQRAQKRVTLSQLGSLLSGDRERQCVV